ncbi:MAG TPA: winged helix-turn-helix domain-containing protein [Kiritimatiellia bacterium]|nr:winged helix-turn-helix domain-containing protein [Kiritimatiellia bacterium]
MSIPDYQSLLLPALKVCEDGLEHRPRDVVRQFSEDLKLTEEEQAELLPSGTQTVLANRTNWALYYLFRAGLLDRPTRGRYFIRETSLSYQGCRPRLF